MALRADAERNRQAIVSAARETFAADGLSASLDEIACRAGVGNATLYRRFPDRGALVEAVFAERMADYADAAHRAAGAEDAWNGLVGFVTDLCRMQVEDQGLSELLTTALFDGSERIAELRRAVLTDLEQTIARAQAAGVLRADFAHQDVVVILMANAGLVRRTRDHAPGAWERHLAFVLAGLRAAAAADAPAPLGVDEIEAAMRAGS
jgi:AcrR family transcriptional regulator